MADDANNLGSTGSTTDFYYDDYYTDMDMYWDDLDTSFLDTMDASDYDYEYNYDYDYDLSSLDSEIESYYEDFEQDLDTYATEDYFEAYDAVTDAALSEATDKYAGMSPYERAIVENKERDLELREQMFAEKKKPTLTEWLMLGGSLMGFVIAGYQYEDAKDTQEEAAKDAQKFQLQLLSLQQQHDIAMQEASDKGGGAVTLSPQKQLS